MYYTKIKPSGQKLPRTHGHLLHKPFGCRCRTTDTDAPRSDNPPGINILYFRDKICTWIYGAALTEEYLAVRTFRPADEKYHIEPRSETPYVRYAVGHLTADSIEITELHPLRHTLFYPLNQRIKSLDRFRCLRKERDWTGEINLVKVAFALHDYGLAIRLTHEAKNLRMAILAVDYYLRKQCVSSSVTSARQDTRRQSP